MYVWVVVKSSGQLWIYAEFQVFNIGYLSSSSIFEMCMVANMCTGIMHICSFFSENAERSNNWGISNSHISFVSEDHFFEIYLSKF